MIFDTFDHARSRAFLLQHDDGVIHITLKGCEEFSLVTLDEPVPKSLAVTGTRFGGKPVRFMVEDVLFVAPIARDPRIFWPEQVEAPDPTRPTRQRPKKPSIRVAGRGARKAAA